MPTPVCSSLPTVAPFPTTTVEEWLQSSLTALHRTIDSLSIPGLAQAIATLRSAWERDARIFIIGNGGNAANAAHFATDLGKGASDCLPKRFRVLSLADNTAWLTALGNDYHFDDVFVRQLQNFAQPGDLLLAGSVSGQSPNLLRAFTWAAEHGLETIALVGAQRGRLAELADQVLVVDDTHYGRVEDAQMHLLHLLCYAFMELPTLTAPSRSEVDGHSEPTHA